MVKKIVFLGVSLFFSALGMEKLDIAQLMRCDIEQLTLEELKIAQKKLETLKTIPYFKDRCESARLKEELQKKELQQVSAIPKKDDTTEKK